MKKMNFASALKAVALSAALPALLTACGGGGGGGGGGGSTPVVYYPYETVYGDACTTSQPIPGCTFNASNGTRVVVNQDPNYNRYGYGSDDLGYVKFDGLGNANVYDDLGHYQYSTSASHFAGFISGTTIGVGTTGMFWENVAGKTYWLGKNGVLYSANTANSNFGQAINNKNAGQAASTSFAALSSAANKALVQKGAQKLMKQYGLSQEKATAVASALNRWAVSGASRGYTTDTDMDQAFKGVFGVKFSSALSAAKGLVAGDKSQMQDLTQQSAMALGLTPAQAQQFMKGMYRKAMAQWGYNVDAYNW